MLFMICCTVPGETDSLAASTTNTILMKPSINEYSKKLVLEGRRKHKTKTSFLNPPLLLFLP